MIALLALLGTPLAACGDDGTGEAGQATGQATEAVDSERYCMLVQQLDQSGEEIFADVSEDDPAALMAAERRLVEENQETLQQLEEAAPSEIAEDVATYTAGFRARAQGEPYDEEAASAAEERILAFEEGACATTE
jgi:hypothetical protein